MMKKAFATFAPALAFVFLSFTPAQAGEGFHSQDTLPLGAGGAEVIYVTPPAPPNTARGSSVGIGTKTPQALLDVDGGLRIGADPRMGKATDPCVAQTDGSNSTYEGALSYYNNILYLCDGTGWKQILPPL